MKKKLLAAALATAFAAPAMADNVQIYGAFDVGVLARSGGGDIQVASGMNGHNGIGFRMSEDLGNGMKISGDAMFGFALDSAGGNFNPSGTNGNFSTIYSYLALSGDFGTLIGGRAGGARAGFIKQYDPFGGFGVGNALQTMGSALGNADYADNVLAWITPEVFPGMKVLAAYTSNLVGQDPVPQNAAGTVRSDLYALAALYNSGPLSVTLAYENAILKAGGAQLSKTGSGHVDVWTAAASYDFGVAKLSALYTNLESYQRGWLVGARAPISEAATFKISYSHSTADTGAGSGTCAKAAAGVDYDLSKRTRVYADVAHLTEQDSTGTCAAGINTNGGSYSNAGSGRDNGVGLGSTGVNVGVRHTF